MTIQPFQQPLMDAFTYVQNDSVRNAKPWNEQQLRVIERLRAEEEELDFSLYYFRSAGMDHFVIVIEEYRQLTRHFIRIYIELLDIDLEEEYPFEFEIVSPAVKERFFKDSLLCFGRE